MITVHPAKNGNWVIEVWDNKARAKSVTVSDSKVLLKLKTNRKAFEEAVRKAVERSPDLTPGEKKAVYRALKEGKFRRSFIVSNWGGKARKGAKLGKRGIRFADAAKKLKGVGKQLGRAGKAAGGALGLLSLLDFMSDMAEALERRGVPLGPDSGEEA